MIAQKQRKRLMYSVVVVIFLFACQLFSPFDPDVTVVTPESIPEYVELPELNADQYPRVDGSTSALPLDMLIACTLLKVHCEWEEWFDGTRFLIPMLAESETFPEIQHNGTHDAYVNLISGDADLIFVARSPSPDELKLAGREEVEFEIAPIALDAFVFIVNIKNPVESLTVRQIQGIYTGEVANWREVGGEDAEVNPYQRNDNSGSQELMKALVMKDLQMIDAPEMMLPTMLSPINAISDDPQGIGYSVYFYEQFMAPNQQLKLLGVEGVVPSFDSIQSHEYTYSTEVYAVVRGDLLHDSLACLFRDWMLTAEGQSVVAESGYVPMR